MSEQRRDLNSTGSPNNLPCRKPPPLAWLPHTGLTLLNTGHLNGDRFLERCQMNDVPTLVTSCINCVGPGSLSATLALILIGAGIAWTAERRKPARVRLDK
jgi:hypothetical protein